MNKIIIFGGTTEGRQLSEYLSRSRVAHTVSVTSDYGHSLIAPGEYVHILTGRMDREEIFEYLKANHYSAGDTVVDATHPYAVLATENIKAAVADTGCRLIHVTRTDADGAYDKDGCADDGELFFYDDAKECFAALDDTEGNILLTTGSKELPAYRDAVSAETLRRTYVRVIPSAESMKICESAGIEPSRVIAMHGPFGVKLNEALIGQYGISHLVTKQSGSTGGYEDKIRACRLSGIRCHIIRRPAEDPGVTAREACRMITGEDPGDDIGGLEHGTGGRYIYLAGAGMGSNRVLTEEVREAVGGADAVFGAERLTKHVNAVHKYPYYLAADIIGVLDEHPEYRRVIVLFSGDSGFYSGAGNAGRKLREWDPEARVKILPGISSVSYLAAMTGESFEDAAIYSLHGRNTARRFNTLTGMIRYNRKTYVLLSGDSDVRELGSGLMQAGISCTIMVGCDMSYENEEVISLTPEEAAHYESEGIMTALVINNEVMRRPVINVLDDSTLIRGKVPMTKECIRHESLIRLELREGDVVYDIGGGTGSVALEAAMLHPSLTVYTVEHDSEAADLIRQNIAKLHMDNVFLTEGEAPEALAGLEAPDAVFIGGSSGRLRDILMAIRSKGTGIRYVVTSVTLETGSEMDSFIREQGIGDARIIQMQVSDIKAVGSHHMMQAQNPVMIYSFTW